MRSLVHKMCKKWIEKPVKLKVNFRSHKGILNLAVNVIDKLKFAFGQSIFIDSADIGLLQGPLAAVYPFPKEVPGASRDQSKAKKLYEASVKMIKDLADYKSAAFMLTPESNVERLYKIMEKKHPMVLSIVDSKGLEFTEVIIIDFFSSIPPADRVAWKMLFTEFDNLMEGQTPPPFPYPQVESQLKNLYVAITRARNRLIFVETGCVDIYPDGKGFEVVENAWKSWSKSTAKRDVKEQLIEKFNAEINAENMDMTLKNDRERTANSLFFVEKVYRNNSTTILILILLQPGP